MFGDDFDNGRADHNAIGDPGDCRRLFGRAHTETDRDGDAGCGLEACDSFLDACLCGLLLAPSAWAAVAPGGLSLSAYMIEVPSGWAILVVAGFLVGFGTRLANGCTSGHGVCGLARFSRRSLVAVLCFMGSGMATVFVSRHVIGA